MQRGDVLAIMGRRGKAVAEGCGALLVFVGRSARPQLVQNQNKSKQAEAEAEAAVATSLLVVHAAGLDYDYDQCALLAAFLLKCILVG